MIAHVSGKISEKYDQSVIVDVHGVGYEVFLSLPDFDAANLDAEAKFYTYHSVRETGEDLYGFSTLAAKKLFQLLISVQKIGPKAAMAILSLGAPEDVRNAIANADVAFVSKASGVGKKSAERVIIDLRDKVGLPSHVGASTPLQSAAAASAPDDALDALIALGFTLKEATAALAEVDEAYAKELANTSTDTSGANADVPGVATATSTSNPAAPLPTGERVRRALQSRAK